MLSRWSCCVYVAGLVSIALRGSEGGGFLPAVNLRGGPQSTSQPWRILERLEKFCSNDAPSGKCFGDGGDSGDGVRPSDFSCHAMGDEGQPQRMLIDGGSVSGTAASPCKDSAVEQQRPPWRLKRPLKWDPQATIARFKCGRVAVATRGGEVAADGSSDAVTTPGADLPASPWTNAIDGLKNGIASGLAAAVVKTILQPFDTMKTVQQFSTTRLVATSLRS